MATIRKPVVLSKTQRSGSDSSSSSEGTSIDFANTSSSSTVFDEDEKTPIMSPIEEKKKKTKKHEAPASNHLGEEINQLDRLQVRVSLGVILAILALARLPQTKPYFSKFISLQNPYPNKPHLYDISFDDIYYIFTWIFIVTFVRALSMAYILRPIAIRMEVSSHKSVQRFKEQGWYLIYYTASFTFGFYIYYNSEYFLSAEKLFMDWPHYEMKGIDKSYYLIELACWLQQIFILNIEEKRKDYRQMFTHHIITCLLVSGSYYYYFTRIGNVIMVLMDVVDIWLSWAKVLKYCGFQKICDVLFGVFLVSWIVLRHGVYNYILYFTAAKGRPLMEAGRCIEGVVMKRCFTDRIINVFVLLLGGLQVIMFIWMYLIAKVAVKVITGDGADDVRSDEED